jgi:hypothetical protein
MSRPRNPNPGLFIDGRDLLYRDYSLTEKQDYDINVKPYIREGYVVVPVGNHFNGAFIVTGWKISQDIYGAK